MGFRVRGFRASIFCGSIIVYSIYIEREREGLSLGVRV